MRKNGIIWLLGSVLLWMTACQDDELLPTIKPAAIGDEVIFGARAGFENSNPKSRTEYSGVDYEYSDKWFERIDWIDGDKIEIYCPDVAGDKSAHYIVNSTGTNPDSGTGNDTDEDGVQNETSHLKDYAYLERISEPSLQWGTGSDDKGTHTFYAMYPSSEMFRETMEDGTAGEVPVTVAQGIKMEGTTVKGIIPTSQHPISVSSPNKDGNYVAKPNMNYAYMVAKNTATPDKGAVGLTFVPVVTAVEVELSLTSNTNSQASSVSIGEIQVTSTNAITGNFTVNLNDWDVTKNAYPTCTNSTENTVEPIQITTRIKNETTELYEPVKIERGKSLKFTVFLLPGSNIADLTIRISDTGAGYVSKTLSNVNIPANLKTRITKLALPTPFVIDASKWMSQLDQTSTIKSLSIPGTGGSFTEGYSGSNPTWYEQQSLKVHEQWKVGVRAFEIMCDRPSNAETTLGGENVICNGSSVGITVKDALDSLITHLDAYPTETAALILTYQPNNQTRNAISFAKSLGVLLNSQISTTNLATYASRLVQYTPTLTINDAKKNIILIVRATQLDEDNCSEDTEDGVTSDWEGVKEALKGVNVLAINGCGTAKDRWGSRGYSIGTSKERALDISTTANSTNTVEYYITGVFKLFSGYSWPDYANNVNVPNAWDNELQFDYKTNTSNSCWFQEWARVCDTENAYYQSPDIALNDGLTVTKIRWYNSYNEKIAALKKTFEMAISNLPIYSDYVYINSLCGYLVDESISASYKTYAGGNILQSTGGTAGNIKGLADKLNPAFYDYVLNSGMENTTGPTGIVLMDYVSNNMADGGSYYLPGTIIANNFKFDNNVVTNPSGEGDSSEEGGSAI